MVVSGLSRGELRALDRAGLSRDAWSAILKVSVNTDGTAEAVPVAGSYAVSSGTIRFTPVLPFEPGRPYLVVFDPAAAPANALRNVPAVSRTVSTPAPARAAQVRVAEIYPGGSIVPENLLRMYVQFSGPMGTRTGQDYIRILDAEGNDIPGALLPLDIDLWNGDRTRFTILFDPGRVKRGILPNRAMGRPLKRGSTFAIVVNRDWPDAQGQPLAAEFRKEYRVGPAIEEPLAVESWRVTAPPAGSRDPLRVTFPAALDRGLLQRTLTVVRIESGQDQRLAGEIGVENGETEWRFVPAGPWRAGEHVISVLPSLEDPSGNRIGHAFETRTSDDDTRRPPERLPFQIR